MTDRTPLPLISRDEEVAIARLHAGSFSMLEALRGFVRNRRHIVADDDRFSTPLERLFNMAEEALERVGFWPEVEDGDQLVVVPRDDGLVIVESPFAGEVDLNVNYARQCLRDSLMRGEHPIASHLLYTQPGVLDDSKPAQRKRGIEAGLAWRRVASKAVFYTGRGWSIGMLAAREVFDKEGFPYEVRDMPFVRPVPVPPREAYALPDVAPPDVAS